MKAILTAKSIFLAVFLGVLASACSDVQTANSSSNLQPATNASSNSITDQRPGVSVEVDSLTPANQQESSKIDDIKARIPDEFKLIGFRNMSYSIAGQKPIRLVNGEFESPYVTKNCNNYLGGLNDVYYLDLDGDKSTEALVDVGYASCGCGSCDGGSHNFYAFRLEHGKPKLFWSFSTGSYGYGGGLRSFRSRPGIIVIEEFEPRKCPEQIAKDPTCFSKFQAKGYVRTELKFVGRTFVRKSMVEVPTEPIDTMNYKVDFDMNNGQ